jgi:BirA family biotin operon repressor/biotin-[acetyl-CoA-carboxylase] ligase
MVSTSTDIGDPSQGQAGQETAASAVHRVLGELAASRAAQVDGLGASQLAELRSLGIAIDDGSARLGADVELLSAEAVRAALAPPAAQWLRVLDCRTQIPSTNTALLNRAETASIHGHVLAAEVQTAGRGRRGRTWLSPFGRNLAVSIGVRLERPAAQVGALSLAVGVAVRQALVDFGVREVELKWPNDVLLDGRKVAGILIELARPSPPVEVVIGIGVNVGCADAVQSQVEQAIADVQEHVAQPSRNRLLALLLTRVAAASARFDTHGFAAFRAEWQQSHRYQGAEVTVSSPSAAGPTAVTGKAIGVSGSGALRVATGNGVREFIGGEVTVREAG